MARRSLITGLIAAVAAFAVLPRGANATAWAQFCDDTACSVNCGDSVSLDNPGCLAESGRHSILFHGVDYQDVELIFSPGSTCDCQNDCIGNLIDSTGGTTYGCLDLTGHAIATGFRFVGGGSCPANQC